MTKSTKTTMIPQIGVKLVKYNKLEKIIARIIDYPIADADEDKPDLPILPVKQAKVALYGRAIDRFVMWLTCFFIIAGVIRHWNG